MKTGVILLSFVLVHFVVAGRDEFAVAVSRGLLDCAHGLRISNETFHSILSKNSVSDRAVNCVRACTLNAIGLMNDTEIIIPKVVESLFPADHPNPKASPKWEKVLMECKESSEKSGDRCEVIEKYLKCLRVKLTIDKEDPGTVILEIDGSAEDAS